jgi:xanthine dehydrogenase accessory factor
MSLDVLKAIVEAVEQGRAGVVATVIRHKGSAPGKEHHKMLVFADGSIVGTIGGGKMEADVLATAAEALDEGHGRTLDLLITEKGEGAIGGICGGRALVALEILPKVPRVLVCGGGHVGVEVARLCQQLQYLHEVHEDREELLTEERFPHARARHLGEPRALCDSLDPARFSHVLIVSRGHVSDRDLAVALGRASYDGWVGMLGSRRKSRTVRKTLVEEDGLDPGFVERIESPVGLSIGARSPAEIAVSIMARIVETMRKEDG